MAEDAPRAEDFQALRAHLELIEHVYAHAEALAQGIEHDEHEQACARRRRLAGELLEWLEAREDLGDLAHSVVASAPLRALPPGGWIG